MAGLFSRIDTVIMRVTDIQKAKQWYQEVLELKVRFEQDNEYKMVCFEIGEGQTPLTIYELQEHETLADRRVVSSHPIFFAENIEEVHAKLTDRGVEVEEIADDGVKWFVFRDPDGNRLEVCHFE